MIPDTITAKIEESVVQPSLTYGIDTVNHKITGKIDNSEAIMQTIEKILDTDKYAYEIYDWNYGQELLKLLGKEFSYAIAEIPRIISEALMQDDRVKEVVDYEFLKTDYNSLTVSFTVKTIFSDLRYVKEIRL